MLSLGPLAFAAPWALLALAVLPALWWLLRVTPPAPRTVAFPAIRLLRDLVSREETPQRTPPWLLLLRILLAGLVILALARPLLNPDAALPGSGPLLLVVDNGWAAGRDWPARQEMLGRLIDQADRTGREVAILPTAPAAATGVPRLIGPMVAADARREAQALQPQPWPGDRRAALAALDDLRPRGSMHAIWLSDGLGADGPGAGGDADLAARLVRLGGVEVVEDGPDRPALLLRPPVADGLSLLVPVERARSGLPQPVAVRASGADGRLLAAGSGAFAADARRTEVRLDLPTELRNEVTEVRLDGQSTAGATILLDERWRRRPVGLVSGPAGRRGAAAAVRPLLSGARPLPLRGGAARHHHRPAAT
ncbi:BatA domain-containing protein [Rhodospirillum centenum]|uniref:BatA domain-containing protein n=1 Tax=Rhodospirillum centenum TaxID=34018 RepID=UPI00031163B1|nr:BatA domain-containing protein [Rhodospirillum centenum]